MPPCPSFRHHEYLTPCAPLFQDTCDGWSIQFGADWNIPTTIATISQLIDLLDRKKSNRQLFWQPINRFSHCSSKNCLAFPGSSSLILRICWFSLTFWIINEESLGFGLDWIDNKSYLKTFYRLAAQSQISGSFSVQRMKPTHFGYSLHHHVVHICGFERNISTTIQWNGNVAQIFIAPTRWTAATLNFSSGAIIRPRCNTFLRLLWLNICKSYDIPISLSCMQDAKLRCLI